MAYQTIQVQEDYSDCNQYSEKLKSYLPEIDPQEKVSFVLLPKGNPVLITETGVSGSEQREMLPFDYSLLATESILDPGTGKYIRIGYFGGAITPSAKPKRVQFKRDNIGIVQVIPAREPDLYLRLMFSAYNRSNPNPNQAEPADGYIFDLIQPEKNAKQKLQDKLRSQKANEFVLLAEVAQLRRLAPKAQVTIPPHKDKDGDELRMNFAAKADLSPALVIALFEADEERLFTLVDSAVKHEVIYYHRESASWKLSKSGQFLTIALPGVNPDDAMVQFLILPENEAILKALRSEVNKKESNR